MLKLWNVYIPQLRIRERKIGLRDDFQREIDYMRISITDRCNLRCCYCMPKGIRREPAKDILTLEEYGKVASCGARLGIRKIKVTGGEPLARLGCCQLVAMLKETPGIEKVTITTNGILLEQYLEDLIQAGIDGINISLDPLDENLYSILTGGGRLKTVMSALERGLKACYQRQIPIKINAVSLDLEAVARQLGCGGGDYGWHSLLRLAKTYPVDVRFIEMMPVGYGKGFQTLDHQTLLKELERRYPGMEKDERVHGNGPAVYYRIPGFLGSVGLISAIHNKFCPGCNRVRLTCQGYLKSCLCYEDGVDLRQILRGKGSWGEKEGRLLAAMEGAIKKKPMAHCFERPEDMTEHDNMVSIGG